MVGGSKRGGTERIQRFGYRYVVLMGLYCKLDTNILISTTIGFIIRVLKHVSMVHTNFIGKRTTKRVAVGASVVLMLVMVGVAMTGTAAADAPDCSTVSYSGDGTTSSPYEVGNVDQLQCIESQGLDASYEITSDIDASGTASWNFGSGFEPIGDDSNPFNGTIDGGGHTITGLTINRGSQDRVGLFGQIGSGAPTVPSSLSSLSISGGVQDINLENVDISGANRVGALAGDSSGSITRSSASGSVAGSNKVGGLVGISEGSITQSFATVDVAGNLDTGGLVGNNLFGTVTNSYARGDVDASGFDAGGLVGFSSGTVSSSYATGSSTGGGLIGEKTPISGSDGTAVDSYWDVPASGQTDSRGGTGLGSSGETPPADEMTGDEAPTNMEGFDFTDTWQTVTDPDGYPVLAWQTEDGGGSDPPDADLVTINSPDTAQPDGDFDFTVEMEESSVGEVAVESSDFDVSLSVVDDDGDDIGAQTDTSVEFIDLDEETSTYTLNVDITDGSEGDTGTITAATGGSIDGSGVDDQTSTTFSLETTTESPVEDVPDDLWAAVTQDDGNEGLSLADLGNAIQQYQANPGNADVGGVDIGLSELGSLIQYYQNQAA